MARVFLLFKLSGLSTRSHPNHDPLCWKEPCGGGFWSLSVHRLANLDDRARLTERAARFPVIAQADDPSIRLLGSPKMIHYGVHFDAPEGQESRRNARVWFGSRGPLAHRVARPSTTARTLPRAWMPGTSPGMTFPNIRSRSRANEDRAMKPKSIAALRTPRRPDFERMRIMWDCRWANPLLQPCQA